MRFPPGASVTEVAPPDWIILTPALSLFATVAVTSRMGMLLYSASLEVAVWLMVTLRLSPWSTRSSTAVTVTVWAVFQLVSVKCNVAGLTVAASVSSEVTAIPTLAAGRVVSFTV